MHHPESLRAILALLALPVFSASALTVPVLQDTYSAPNGKLTPANGKAGTLLVTGTQSAFVQFNLTDLPTVPAGIQPASVVSASLRVFFTRVTQTGTLSVHRVTGTWNESVKSAAPTFDPTPIIDSGSATLTTKDYFAMDVTAAFVDALTAGTDLSFALVSTTGSSLTLAAKEGAFPACELIVETNYGLDAEGFVNANAFMADGDNGSVLFNPGIASTPNTTVLGVLTGKNGYGPQLRFTEESGTQTDIGQDGSGNFVIEQDNTAGFVLTADGKVGIGVTDPSTRLELGAASGTALRLRGPGGVGTTLGIDFATYDPTDVADTPSARILATEGSFSADLDFQTKTPGNADNALVSRLKITAAGDVKVGPNTSLSVAAGEESLRIIRGTIGASGNIVAGSGFTVTRPIGVLNGDYTVTFDSAFSAPPTVTVTMSAAAIPLSPVIAATDAVSTRVQVFAGVVLSNPTQSINFIAIGPR